MALRDSQHGYGVITKWLHWLLASLIIGMLAFGVYMEDLALSPTKLRYYGWHKSLGIVILGLVVLRMVWKCVNPTPSLPRHMTRFKRIIAYSFHGLLYTLMFYMPITGWLMSSAAGFPISVFGLPPLPNLIAPDKEMVEFFKELHEIGLWVFAALITFHICAAFFHHFYYKDGILLRMLPNKKTLSSFLLALFLCISASTSYAATHTVIKEKSKLKFAAIVNDAASFGHFSDYELDINFYPEKPEDSVITGTVNLTPDSITADYEDVAKNIINEDWLNISEFNTATLIAKEFERHTDNTYQGRGSLTLLGQTHPVDIHLMLISGSIGGMQVSDNAQEVIGIVTISVDRLKYGIGKGEWRDTSTVDKEVVISGYIVTLTETAQPPQE